MNIPAELQYTDHDEWVRTEDGLLVVGITDYAQEQLGELAHVELPDVGASVAVGELVCEVESVKAVAEIYAPATGKVAAVNNDLEDSPEQINSDPYGAWIYKIEVEAAPTGLLSAAEYQAKLSD